MANVTGTVSDGTVTTTFTGTSSGSLAAGVAYVGTITAVAPPPPVTTVSIFTNQSPSTLTQDGPSTNYELGTVFRASGPGQITGIRFWKNAKETGTHTGRIWSSSGTALASVVFANETISGWQTATLATPLSIAAGTYTVSVNTGNTWYVATNSGLKTVISNGPLSTIVGPNGTYGTSGKFPTASWQNSNYFRDVLFVAGPVVADTTAPSVPTNVRGTASSTSVNLSWNVSTDNIAVAGYNVFRNATKIGTVPTNSFADGGLTPATSYTYTVAAFDAAGNTSAQSMGTILVTQAGGGGGGGGTGPVSHGDQLTINNVGPWTLQGVAKGSESLDTVAAPGRGFWLIATNSEYAPTGTYVYNNTPSNKGGIVPAGGLTIDGYFFPAGTVVCQFRNLSATDFSCQGQGGSYLFRGCRFRQNGIGASSQFNDFTSTYVQALHFCDMGGLSANIADWQMPFWKMIGGGPHRCYRNYMTYQYVALQPNTDGFECTENYIDKITFFGGEAGPPGQGGPEHIAAIGCEGGRSGFRIMRNRIVVPSPDDLNQWVITNGATIAMEGTGGGAYSDCQVVDNYIGGANFAFLAFGEDAGQTNIVATGNKFTTQYWTNGGVSGILQAGPFPVPWGSSGNVKANNTFADDYGTGGDGTGTPLSSRQYPNGDGPRKGTSAF